jgi:hypothetical protein
MSSSDLNADLYGWWRIIETSQWVSEGLDDLGPAMLSITGHADRLRMHCLLAYVNVRPTKNGASFSWNGSLGVRSDERYREPETR